jgi:hypothetical protein
MGATGERPVGAGTRVSNRRELRRMARITNAAAEELLRDWQSAFGAGNIAPADAGVVVDALLDLKLAALALSEPAASERAGAAA